MKNEMLAFKSGQVVVITILPIQDSIAALTPINVQVGTIRPRLKGKVTSQYKKELRLKHPSNLELFRHVLPEKNRAHQGLSILTLIKQVRKRLKELQEHLKLLLSMKTAKKNPKNADAHVHLVKLSQRETKTKPPKSKITVPTVQSKLYFSY